MIKNNKWKLFISSIIILMPIIFGIVFWNKLPEQMAIHWGVDGTIDGVSNRYVAVFALPVFLLFIHWLCVFCTVNDPKNKSQNNKVFSMLLCICPIMSLFSSGIIYATSLGKEIRITSITLLLIGLMFIIIGNYLPNCKQNYTIGIRVKWTLENEANWNATHRFSGKIWIVGGLILMSCGFLTKYIVLWWIFFVIILLGAIPILYSYQYHKKQLK